VASTGFGNGTAIPPPSSGKRGTLQNTGFADQTVATEAPKKKASTGESATTPVNILDQVNRVVSGLGHGLDEAATRAAQQIKFKPARREGQPVDFPARVRIEFRLAY
jgi:hypothetical protein